MILHKYHSGDYTLVHNRFFDEYMPSANGEFVKIYLYLLRSSDTDRELSLSVIADIFNHTESDVKRALTYWEKKNLLQISYTPDGELKSITLTDGVSFPDPQKDADCTRSAQRTQESVPSYAEETAVVSGAGNRLDSYVSHAADFPLRSDSEPKRISISADRKKELAAQEDIQQLMYIAQQYLGKKLSSTEVTNILYFYDELHFSVDLIEYLIEYCVSKGKRSISYIRAVALEWASKQISTVADAKKDTNLYSKDYYAVMNAFGIKDRGELTPGFFADVAAVDAECPCDFGEDGQIQHSMAFDDCIFIFLEIAREGCITDDVRAAVVIADVIKMCGPFHYELFSNLERNKACIFAYDEKMQQVIFAGCFFY